MRTILSDDGQYTFIFGDGSDEPEEMTKEEFVAAYGEDALPSRKEPEEENLPVLEYLGEFKALIDACGKVSYYFNMKKFVAAEVNKAKKIASAYEHDLAYYKDQCNEWKVKAERSYEVLKLHAAKFGYEMPAKKDYLNSLTISKDRRAAYKGYLATCLKNRKTLSPAELERKFQNLLKKRLKRKA